MKRLPSVSAGDPAARGPGLATAALACLVCGSALAGCGPQAPPRPAATTRPDVPASQPVPTRAQLRLDQLQPPIPRPVNPKDADRIPERASEAVAEARNALARGDHDAAVRSLERAIAFEPTNPRILALLGKAYLGASNRGKAAASLQAAIKVAPDDLESRLLLGQLLAAQQRTGEAIECLRAALMCSAAAPANPLTGEALLTLGLLLEREGYWTAALECFTSLGEAVEKHGRDYADRPALRDWVLRPERLQARRGDLLGRLQRPREAAELLLIAYRRDRTNRLTARLLVEAMLASRQHAQAEKLLLEMAGHQAQQSQVPALLTRLCVQTRDRELPGRFWQAFRAKNDLNPSIAVALAEGAQRLGWPDEAMSILQSVLSAKPGDAGLWRVLGRTYARTGRYAELLDHAERCLRSSPEALGAIAGGMVELAGACTTEGVERQIAELVRQRDPQSRPAGAERPPSSVHEALLYLAGTLAAAKGKHLLASDLYGRAIQARADFAEACEALLESWIAQKRPDKVNELVSQVERAGGGQWLAAYLRGKAAVARGDTRAAINALEQAVAQKPGDARSLLLLADVYIAVGRGDEAIDALRRAMRARPDEPEAYRRLFQVCLGRGQLREARGVVQELLGRQADSPAGRLMLAELALRAGRRDEALQLLAQLEEERPDDAEVQLCSARAALGGSPGLPSKEAFDQAAAKLGQVIRAQPAHRAARLGLAELLAAVGRAGEAAGILASLLEESPTDAEALRRYVQAQIRQRQYAPALRAVQRFIQDRPDDIWARLALLELLGLSKDFDQAEKLGDQWVRTASDDGARFGYRQALLRVFQDGQRPDKALKVLDAWLADAPGEGRLARAMRQDRIRLLAAAGQFDKATAEADQLIRAEPESPAPRQAIVLGAIQAKHYDRAVNLLADWIASDARNAQSYRALTVAVLSEAKQLDKARQFAQSWLRQEPKSLPARRAVIGALVEQDRYAEAGKLADQWLKELPPTTSPSQPAEGLELARWVRQTAVRLRVSQDRHAEGLKLAEAMLRIDPGDAEMLALRSGCLTELGRWQEAIADLEAAVRTKADDPGLSNNLGYLYAEQGVNLDRAESMLRKALAARPGEVAFIDSLGWILYKQGRLGEAGAVFQGLVDGPRDEKDEKVEHGVILDHAGDTYCRLGWKDRAVECWKRAIDLARQAKRPSREDRQVLADAPAKIDAVARGREPKLAPLASGPQTRAADGAGPAAPERLDDRIEE